MGLGGLSPKSAWNPVGKKRRDAFEWATNNGCHPSSEQSTERHGAACAILVLSAVYSKNTRHEAGVSKQNSSFSRKGTFGTTTWVICSRESKWESPRRRTLLVPVPWGITFSYCNYHLCSWFLLSCLWGSRRKEGSQGQQSWGICMRGWTAQGLLCRLLRRRRACCRAEAARGESSQKQG